MTEEKIALCSSLEHSWRLWHLKPNRYRTWEENLVPLSTFDTKDKFWRVYNNIELPSRLRVGSDYQLFKSDIQPTWKDQRNIHGGRWVFSYPKKGCDKEIDVIWLNVMLCLIDEDFGDYNNQICGAMIHIRPKLDKIAVWTSDCNARQAVLEIGRIVKQAIGFRDTARYESHLDDISQKGSTTSAKYTI